MKIFHNKDISNMSFLVTGGAGFIGSHIVEYLIYHGAKKVRVVDNLLTGFLKNIEPFLNLKNFEFIQGDLCDYTICKDACKDIDIVFHQAALGSVPRSIENPINTNLNNVNTQLNILWACKESNIERVIYASSSSVYGDDNTIPKVEDKTGMPLSPYAVSKKVNELYADVFYKLYNLKVIGLRYFNVFGPRQNPKGDYAAVIPLFIDSLKNNTVPTIYGDGEQSRDFTYVENIVQANIKTAFTDNKNCFGNVMNIGAGGNTSVNDLYNFIAKEFNVASKPKYAEKRKGDVLRSSASIAKAEKLIDYKPSVLIEEGIKRTIEYIIN